MTDSRYPKTLSLGGLPPAEMCQVCPKISCQDTLGQDDVGMIRELYAQSNCTASSCGFRALYGRSCIEGQYKRKEEKKCDSNQRSIHTTNHTPI
jgi:hypothetical protein